MDLNLQNKRALVCGASSGIGASVALELANLGCNVVLLARNLEKLETVRKSLPNKDNHSIVSCDLFKTSHIQSSLEKTLAQGPFHILVCNAGGPASGPLMEANEEQFLSVFHTHLLASHKLVQMLLPGMKKSGYGRIINIISTSVKAPIPGLGVSNTIRGAVANWSKTLSMELGPFGITVNNVLPGFTSTPRLEELKLASAEKKGITAEQLEKEWIATVPLRRVGSPNEVANAVAFLASPAAAYISGINVPVDGGRTPSL